MPPSYGIKDPLARSLGLFPLQYVAVQDLGDRAHKKVINSRYDYGDKAHKQSHGLLMLIYARGPHFVHQYQNTVCSITIVRSDPLHEGLNDLHLLQFHEEFFRLQRRLSRG